MLMLRRILKSRTGSTLVMVLLFMTIISMLGVTILTVALFNYKMKSVDVDNKKHLYAAEAGIEEAEAIIEEFAFGAINYANGVVEDNLADPGYEYLYTDYVYDDEGSLIEEAINQDKLDRTLEIWFKDGYQSYIKNGDTDKDSLDTTLNDLTVYTTTILFGNSFSISTKEANEFDKNDEYVIEVTSAYHDEDGHTRSVSKEFTISTPEYDQPYYEEVFFYSADSLNIDGFIDNILTAEGDILFEGGNVTIESGNVFANGGGEETVGNDDGIIISSGTLTTQQGNLITKKLIRAEGSNIDIDISGDVYCNSLVIDEASGNVNISIGDKEDDASSKYLVLTEDDIDFNGSNSAIEIYGSYYGFSVGLKGHDSSSAIVVNSPDIGYSSKIIITGEAADHSISNDNPKDPVIVPHGTILGGTAYINFSDVQKYQTGESVSVTGNYVAYTQYTIPNVIDDVNASLGSSIEITYPDNYGTYTYSDGDTSIDVELADTYVEADETKDLLAKQKGEIVTQSQYYPDVINISVGWDEAKKTGIKLSNVLYSSGAYISEGNIMNDRYAYNEYSDELAVLADKYDKVTEKLTIGDEYSYGEKVSRLDNSSRAMIFLSDSESDDIALIGGGGSTPSQTKYSFNVGSKPIEGIIITKGDIYLTGDIDFEGIIAAGGDIFFKDSGTTKTLTLNQNVKIESDTDGIGTESGLDNYIDTSKLIKGSSWEMNHE